MVSSFRKECFLGEFEFGDFGSTMLLGRMGIVTSATWIFFLWEGKQPIFSEISGNETYLLFFNINFDLNKVLKLRFNFPFGEQSLVIDWCVLA